MFIVFEDLCKKDSVSSMFSSSEMWQSNTETGSIAIRIQTSLQPACELLSRL